MVGEEIRSLFLNAVTIVREGALSNPLLKTLNVGPMY
jgi:hypothetical protein